MNVSLPNKQVTPQQQVSTVTSIVTPPQPAVVAPVETGYQVCSEEFPNTTWDGTYGTDGKFNCPCLTGYVLSSDKTSCQLQTDNSAQIDALYQQIITIKEVYNDSSRRLGEVYAEKIGANDANPIPLQFAEGRDATYTNQYNLAQQNLLNDANAKIEQINLKIQQLQLNQIMH